MTYKKCRVLSPSIYFLRSAYYGRQFLHSPRLSLSFWTPPLFYTSHHSLDGCHWFVCSKKIGELGPVAGACVCVSILYLAANLSCLRPDPSKVLSKSHDLEHIFPSIRPQPKQFFPKTSSQAGNFFRIQVVSLRPPYHHHTMANSSTTTTSASAGRRKTAANSKAADGGEIRLNGAAAAAAAASQAQEEVDKKVHDFFWTYTEEPHRTRRLAIIKAHPEVCLPRPPLSATRAPRSFTISNPLFGV